MSNTLKNIHNHLISLGHSLNQQALLDTRIILSNTIKSHTCEHSQ